jgi:hypothetical protein
LIVPNDGARFCDNAQKEIRNLKHEIRNKHENPNTNDPNCGERFGVSYGRSNAPRFGHLDFENLVLFRISDFEFWILVSSVHVLDGRPLRTDERVRGIEELHAWP